MIHSLAGGSFREKRVLDFVKVQIGDNFFWYTTGGIVVNVGDKVLVPLKKMRVEGLVVRVDYQKIEGQTPIPINMAKEIIKKL